MQADVYIRMQCGSGNADGASLCGFSRTRTV